MELDTSSEAAAIESLKGLIPEDGYNIGQAEEEATEPQNNAPVTPDDKEDAPSAELKEQPDVKEAEAKEQEPSEVEIEFEGNRYKIPAELKSAIMMQADYTKKTMELADQRKALEANKVNPQEIEQYKNKVTLYENLLGQQVLQDQRTNWQELLKTDPIGYLQQKEQAEARKAEWDRLSAAKQQESQQKLSQTLDQEAQQLIAKQPEWKDVAKFNADKEKIFPSLEKIGYTRQEFDSVIDHRALIVANKARLYDELMAAKADTAKRIEKLPPKVERPGVPDVSESQVNKTAYANLKKSGSIDDAAAVLRSLMN